MLDAKHWRKRAQEARAIAEQMTDPVVRKINAQDEATAKAREMVEAMRRKGDHDGADTWLRIIVAIGELGEPPNRGTALMGKRHPQTTCRSHA